MHRVSQRPPSSPRSAWLSQTLEAEGTGTITGTLDAARGSRSGDAPPYGHPRYGAAYWDAWHATAGSEAFDWYVDYWRLRELFREQLPNPSDEPEILDVGCGNSEIPSRLFDDGWQYVTAIDLSAEAIRLAKTAGRNSTKHEMQFLQMDVASLDFPDDCFHVVFDKATFDTIVSSSQAYLRAQTVLSEIYRVLRPGGIYLMVSHSGPWRRVQFLTKDKTRPWQIQVAKLEGSSFSSIGSCDGEEVEDEAKKTFFYVYLCQKPKVSVSLEADS